MPIALRTSGNGRLKQFQDGEILSIDRIERLSSSGDLQIGASLGAADELQLGSAVDLTRVMGDFIVDGQVEDDLHMGNNQIIARFLNTTLPPTISSQQDDYDPADLGITDILRVATSGDQTITGFASPGAGDNKEFWVVHTSPNTLTITHDDVDSTAGNRVYCPDSTDITLELHECAHIIRDLSSGHWRVASLSKAAGSGSGDVTGPGSSTDNAIARFDSTTGKLIQNSGITISDSDDLADINTASYSGEYDNGNSGASITIDWNNGNKQLLTLTANAALSFTDPPGPCSVSIRLVQNATGGWLPTWPSTVRAPNAEIRVATTGTTGVSLVGAVFDGTNYWITSAAPMLGSAVSVGVT